MFAGNRDGVGPSISLAARPSTRGPPPRLRGLRHNGTPALSGALSSERSVSRLVLAGEHESSTRAGAEVFEKPSGARGATRSLAPSARVCTRAERGLARSAAVTRRSQVTTGTRARAPTWYAGRAPRSFVARGAPPTVRANAPHGGTRWRTTNGRRTRAVRVWCGSRSDNLRYPPFTRSISLPSPSIAHRPAAARSALGRERAPATRADGRRDVGSEWIERAERARSKPSRDRRRSLS